MPFRPSSAGGPPGDPSRGRHRCLVDRGNGTSIFGLNAVEGRHREDWGKDPGASTRSGPAAPTCISGRAHRCQRRARLAELPIVARDRRAVLCPEQRHRVRGRDHPGPQRLGDRRVGGRLPRPVHSARHLGFMLGADWMGDEIRRISAKGGHAVSCHPDGYRLCRRAPLGSEHRHPDLVEPLELHRQAKPDPAHRRPRSRRCWS